MKKNRRMLLILILICSTLFIFNPKTFNLLQSKLRGEVQKVINVMELELPHSSQIVHIKQNEEILQYWDGILYSYNMTGTQNWSINIGVINPIIEINEKYIYIVDKSKNQIIKINNKGEIEYRSVLNKNIGFIKSSEGAYLLVYHAPDNNMIRNMSILKEGGKAVGDILVSEGEVINALISEKENRIILHTIGTRDGMVEGKLIYYNLKGELIRLESVGENIILSMSYDGKGNLILVYEDKIVSLNNDQKTLWQVNTEDINKIDLSKNYLLTYNSREGRGGIIQARSKEKIQIIDFNGRVIGENTSIDNIVGLDTYKNDIIAYSSRTIYLLSNKGEIIMEHKFSRDIEEVFILSQKYIGVITKENLFFMRIQ